jgi:hypothetical protein
MRRLLFVVYVLCIAVTTNGAIVAQDDFTYADGNLAGNAGGTGWAGAWTNFDGTPATVVGGVAQTAFSSGSGWVHSQVTRSIDVTLTSTWIRATVQKTVTSGIAESFGGIGLFENGSEKGLIGNFWPGVAVDAWGAGPHPDQGEIAGELVTTLSDVVVYISGTETKLWVNGNPLNLGTPEAIGSGVGQFNQILLRCGTNNNGETWQFDNLVVGETAADIGVVVPEPVTMAFLGFGALALIRRRK